MSSLAAKKTVLDTTPKGCLGDHGKCPEPVLAKRRCGAHYRRWLRNDGKDKDIDDAPVLAHRGELVPLSLRVPKDVAKALEKAGGGYRVGAEVLEAWVKEQAGRTSGTSDAEEVLDLRAEVVGLKAKLKEKSSS
jgi:hypothetical protein